MLNSFPSADSSVRATSDAGGAETMTVQESAEEGYLDVDNGSHHSSSSATDTAAEPIDTSAAQGHESNQQQTVAATANTEKAAESSADKSKKKKKVEHEAEAPGVKKKNDDDGEIDQPKINAAGVQNKNDDDVEINQTKIDAAAKRARWLWWLYRVLSTILLIAAIAVGTLYAQWYQQDIGGKHYPSNCNAYGWSQTSNTNKTGLWYERFERNNCIREKFAKPIPIHLAVSNCRVDILGRKDWPGLDIQYSKGRDDGSTVKLPDWDSSTPTNENQSLAFIFERTIPTEELDVGNAKFSIEHGCRVLISVGDDTISDLTVEVKDSGPEGRVELSMTHVEMSGVLDIRGATMNFRGREIVAADVNIQLDKGTVDFSSEDGGNGITIVDHTSGAIDINLADGDIVVAPVATSQVDLQL